VAHRRLLERWKNIASPLLSTDPRGLWHSVTSKASEKFRGVPIPGLPDLSAPCQEFCRRGGEWLLAVSVRSADCLSPRAQSGRSAGGLNWAKTLLGPGAWFIRRVVRRQFAWNRQNEIEAFACASPASAHALIKVETFCSSRSSKVRETGGMASWSR
jgi:hypothetical protein